MKEMRQVGLSISLAHTTSSKEPYRYSTLRIDDRRSGFTIVEVDLSAEQVYELLTSHQKFYEDGIPGLVIEDDALPFVGKATHTFTRLFQRDYDVTDFPRDDPGQSPHLDSWGRMVMGALWAHRFRWGARNNGISYTVWRYSNDLTPDMVAKTQAMLDLYPAPEGLK